MSNAKQRKRLVMLKLGVWVHQAADGTNYCKVKFCRDAPASLEPHHRGLCIKHFENYDDGRPRCKQCHHRFAVAPMTDQLCENCHPAFQEVTPFETHVLEEIRKGAAPVQAVQAAMGPGATAVAASHRLSRMSRSAKTHKRMTRAMAQAGITPDRLFKKLNENIDATKSIYNNEGELVAEVPDVRASNQAIDMSLKVMGAYPSKTRSDKDKPQTTNVAVAVLPAVEPRRPDAQIYTLPERKKAVNSGGDE